VVGSERRVLILGINAYHADASAVLLHDGRVVVAIEEERLRRVKHWAGFPAEAVRACLDAAGVSGREIDVVAVGRRPTAHLLRRLAFTALRRPAPRYLAERLRHVRGVAGIGSPLAEALRLAAGDLPRIENVEHHPAHLASAFYPSPFEDASVCAIDAAGDFVTSSWGSGGRSGLLVAGRHFFPHSLGILYSALTQFLGFPAYGDEFKVMGLAAYGEPEQLGLLRRMVRLRPGGGVQVDLRYFRHAAAGFEMEWSGGYPRVSTLHTAELERLLGPARQPDAALDSWHRNLARSVQDLYEECLFHVLNAVWARHRNPRLCLAGGCAMNSVANGKIREQTPFDEIFIQPAAGDAGTALGAALHVWQRAGTGGARHSMEHAYWGPDRDGELAAAVSSLRNSAGADLHIRAELDASALCQEVAGLLAEGRVVGWYQGRMEWGPRALGNRSILADPRRADARERLNERIKLRETFRPFAMSILSDEAASYLEAPASDPFMTQVRPVRHDRRAEIPAVVHVDGTARYQTVTEAANPAFHRLLCEFRRLTGIPLLLNTSFNESEPIVDTPEQAIDCFLRTRMDALVLGSALIIRQEALIPESASLPLG
jgi:carbamoyltransferase